MGDLISKAELFNKLATAQTMGEAYAVIQAMPSAVKTSQWNLNRWYTWECSNCGLSTQPRTAYCPFCGAEMDF